MTFLDPRKVFVALSGGVDSSVAAALLLKQGFAVEGVTMRFQGGPSNPEKPAGVGTAAEAARQVAENLGIPFHLVDLTDQLERLVISDFTAEYLCGRTPNPCVRCNRYLKFGVLLQRATELGAAALATGHYARVEYQAAASRYDLKKAVDAQQDQSYFLYGIRPADLARVIFPLGGMSKTEVRQTAKDLDLVAADRPDSQDICFVPADGYKEFIRARVGEQGFVPGDFKNQQGAVVGRHQGIANYTIGQRDKLGIALGVPVYVTRIDRESNTVYVGGQESLLSGDLVASQVNCLAPDILKEGARLGVRIRYHAREIPGTVERFAAHEVRFRFDSPQKAVTPGQSAVFYCDDLVVGGGIIAETSA